MSTVNITEVVQTVTITEEALTVNVVEEVAEVITVGTQGPLTADIDYKVLVDDYTTPNIQYIGRAAIGSATSAAVWQIAKLDTSSGLVKTWADGDALFNNVWNNRTSLTYS